MSTPIVNCSVNGNKPQTQRNANKTGSNLRSNKLNKSPRAVGMTGSAAGNATVTVSVKSKYTEKKPALPPMRTRSLRLDLQPTAINASKEHQAQQVKVERKVVIQSIVPKTKQWNRREIKPKMSSLKVGDKMEPATCVDMGTQTNEMEILNHDLLIGDIKFMLPTQSLVSEIDRERQDIKKKAMLKAQRKFEEHAEKQEEHLTDLKEFLEKAVVTKRVRKPRDVVEIDKKLINSMDEILNREVRRTESITDIKGRIKKKEKELLSLFDTVESIQILGNKN